MKYRLPDLEAVRDAIHKVRIQDLHERTGVSQQCLRMIRRGDHKSPRYITIKKIVDALNDMGVTIDD